MFLPELPTETVDDRTNGQQEAQVRQGQAGAEDARRGAARPGACLHPEADRVLEGRGSRAAEAEKARIARAEAMSAIGAEIIVDLEVDLNDYTHLALVNVIYADNATKKYSGKSQYEKFEGLFSSSPLALINPYKENRRKAKKNKQFLKEMKNPSWLYLYYETSAVGVDMHRSFVVRDSENKIIYRGKYVNTPKSDMVAPFVFY